MYECCASQKPTMPQRLVMRLTPLNNGRLQRTSCAPSRCNGEVGATHEERGNRWPPTACRYGAPMIATCYEMQCATIETAQCRHCVDTSGDIEVRWWWWRRERECSEEGRWAKPDEELFGTTVIWAGVGHPRRRLFHARIEVVACDSSIEHQHLVIEVGGLAAGGPCVVRGRTL